MERCTEYRIRADLRGERVPAGVRPPAAEHRAASGGAATVLLASAAALVIAQQLPVQLARLDAAPFRPDAAIAVAALAVGAATAVWYALTGIALLVGTLVHRELGVASWGAPVARRLAIGTALTLLSVAPAGAATPDDVSWGATVAVAPAAQVAAGEVASGHGQQPAADPPPSTHTVEPGECLWEIADDDLGEGSAAAVAARVRAYISANPHLADHPDLIHPGDVLIVPEAAR